MEIKIKIKEDKKKNIYYIIYPWYSLPFKSPRGYAWVNYLNRYVLPFSLKRPLGCAWMELIREDKVKLLLTPFKRPLDYAWLACA